MALRRYRRHRDTLPIRGGLPPPLIGFDLAKPTTRVYDIANAVCWWVPSCEPLDRAPAFAGAESRRTSWIPPLGYFENNAPGMCYHWFRQCGLFVGSGVVEVSCKSVIGHRLKQAGMHWTVSALRCQEASSTWEAICSKPGTARSAAAAAICTWPHGSLNAAAPTLSCLYLNPDAGEADGRLFAYELARFDLRDVDLVTLSACESVLSRTDIADNLVGIPAAVLRAGARTVIGCLWPVGPEPAAVFFTVLYHQVASHAGKLHAYRPAQQGTRDRYPQYRDWGAFCYLGEWRASQPEKGPHD